MRWIYVPKKVPIYAHFILAKPSREKWRKILISIKCVDGDIWSTKTYFLRPGIGRPVWSTVWVQIWHWCGGSIPCVLHKSPVHCFLQANAPSQESWREKSKFRNFWFIYLSHETNEVTRYILLVRFQNLIWMNTIFTYPQLTRSGKISIWKRRLYALVVRS